MRLVKKALFGGSCLLMIALSESSKATDVTSDSAMKIETIKISNHVCEAEITVKPFVHLLGFRLLGAKNHLLNIESPNPSKNGHSMRPLFIVGAKLWYAPEVAGSHLFGLLTGEVTQKGREVDVNLDRDPGSRLQGRIRFVLDETKPQLKIISVLRNEGASARETSCWWPVSFEPGGRMEAAPIPSPSEPAFNYHFWSYSGTASEPGCKITKTNVVLDLDRPPEAPIFKIGFLGREIILIKPDCVYRMTILDPPVDPARNYPHGGSPVMLYCDQKTWFCEAELSGPLIKLQPQEETSFIFTISLEPSPKG